MNELRWILKSLGDDLTEEDIDDMIADVDTDGSGWVDYDGMLSSQAHASKSVIRACMLCKNPPKQRDNPITNLHSEKCMTNVSININRQTELTIRLLAQRIQSIKRIISLQLWILT